MRGSTLISLGVGAATYYYTNSYMYAAGATAITYYVM